MAPQLTGFALLHSLPMSAAPPLEELLDGWFKTRGLDEHLASFAKGLKDLIDLLEMDDNSYRISWNTYQPLFNYMKNYDGYFDEPCDKELTDFRRWIEGYYLWSRLERNSDTVYSDDELQSQVSDWMSNDSRSTENSSLTETLQSFETAAGSSTYR